MDVLVKAKWRHEQLWAFIRLGNFCNNYYTSLHHSDLSFNLGPTVTWDTEIIPFLYAEIRSLKSTLLNANT